MTALLTADGVGIRHDGHAAFTPADVRLSVHPGEVVLLLGPSGCGKSTFAMATNGLVPQTIPAELRGRVLLGDVATTERPVPRLAERVGMVFQDPDAGIITGSVLDEVCFAPENQRQPVGTVLRRAERALRAVGLWERRDEQPGRLSGGGRQRLAIAAALAGDAPLIVLDEPTANLDAAGARACYQALARVVADGEHALLLVEHDLDECVSIVDRVVVLDRRGRVALEGTPDEVLAGRAEAVLALGVWLPIATRAALRLRSAGYRLDPLPLTVAQLVDALEAEPEPAAVSAPRPVVPAEVLPEPPRVDPAIVVERLGVARGGHTLLDDVSFTVPTGAMLAIVGPNGAGKTTLLQHLGGIRRPPRGTVRVAGMDPARARANRLSDRVGYVFQNPEHQFIRSSVADELAHGLEVRGVPAPEVARRVDAMLERFGLTAHRDAHPFLLSGGQKRRLSVGTALITGADVLLLDEPTYGQDFERAAELLDLLTALNEAGTTVVLVSHDLQLVAEHASHVAVLDAGRLVACDRTEAVLAGDALDAAGLGLPPLAAGLRRLRGHPRLAGALRLRDLPGGPR